MEKQKFKESSHAQNRRERSAHIDYALGRQTPIPRPTLQRKVSAKIEKTIKPEQLIEAARLFKECGKPKPGWLRQKFFINQRRRKCLNVELEEAQLDKVFCGQRFNVAEWDGLLHLLWHDINEEPSCV